MNVFFDTSVLVAASERSHPHYNRAKHVLVQVATGKDRGFACTHSIAEVYAALTRLPVTPRIHPMEASRIIQENILPHFELVPLQQDDYVESVRQMASWGLAGAKIYDLLLLRCAERSRAERIYTFNLADFVQLAPSPLHEILCAP